MSQSEGVATPDGRLEIKKKKKKVKSFYGVEEKELERENTLTSTSA